MEEKIICETYYYIRDFDINEDGSNIFTFGRVYQGQNIKIIIHSNENSNHNRPHVHAFCNDKEYQISIDNCFEELNNKCDKYCKFIIKNCFEKNIQNFRREWNNIISNYKFDMDENHNYVCCK